MPEILPEPNSLTHGHTRGRRRSPTYVSWEAMKHRCYQPSNPRRKYYAERGIKVCDRWIDSFQNFLEDMGERPIGCSIDRIDGYGNYEPENCRWSSYSTQRRNRADLKLKLRQVEMIRLLLADQWTNREIAANFGVSKEMISAIKLRRSWK
jgi:DNA-binding CsgD family transcriptional regulator